ncbi:MAG: hypothetical protein JRN52_00075 [Nitrososphaerota archaeon]|nr:hypothetical protein [Nitrososphaerota archaeon]
MEHPDGQHDSVAGTIIMQSLDDRRRKYCANCGKEIKPGQGVEINDRFAACSKDCEKAFTEGKLL